jgi:hypothetical protein
VCTSRRGVEFVRAGREIDTLDALPSSTWDRAAGLSSWPLRQRYAYHWGNEVDFTPASDEGFGMSNDRQRVWPIEAFCHLLVAKGMDVAARAENRSHEQHRLRAPGDKLTLTAAASWAAGSD